VEGLDIVRFVIEGDDVVEQIVFRAVSELRRTTRGKHLTFASALSAGSLESLRAVAEALNLYLSDDYHLLYEFVATIDPAKLLTAAQCKLALGDPTKAILDARSPEEFRGEEVTRRTSGLISGC